MGNPAYPEKPMFKKNHRHLQMPLTSNVDELPEKLRKRLENSWAGAFYREIYCRIDEAVFAVLYADCPSRPNVPVNVLWGLNFSKRAKDGRMRNSTTTIAMTFRCGMLWAIVN